MTNKQKVAALLASITKEVDIIEGVNLKDATAKKISQLSGLQRNVASKFLNELVKEKGAIKVNTRPVLFFDKNILEEKYGVKLTYNTVFPDLSKLQHALDKTSNTDCQIMEVNSRKACSDVFSQMVGYDGSLKFQIEQCKAAIRYPPNGLPILITGPTGSGKSFLAQLMYDYAREKNIIENESPFVIFNCAEYADNPELLSANLFGYQKGAFTGADHDHRGIIEEADTGFLFLDEIHRLTPEGQEKLFLFLDKGIFRRMGENKGWRQARVRFIFATTEKPQDFLISTFLRRIPIVINLPSLKERPLGEKYKLIYNFFREEAISMRRDLIITGQAFDIFAQADFKGNVGQLRNDIKLTCARAYNDYCNSERRDGCIEVHLMMIPERQTYSVISNNFNSRLDSLAPARFRNKSIKINWKDPNPVELLLQMDKTDALAHKKFYESLLETFRGVEPEFFRQEVGTVTGLIDDYFDQLILNMHHSGKEDLNNVRFETIRNVVHGIFEIYKNKFDLKYHDNIGYRLACYLNQTMDIQYFLRLSRYDHKFTKCLEKLKQIFPEEISSVEKILDLIDSNLDLSIGTTEKLVIIMYLLCLNIKRDVNRTKAVIIAHGYSTASSIASVANHLLGEKIFESFDMPIEVKTEEIIKKIVNFMREVNTSKGVIFLVDMGSLEEIYKGLEPMSKGIIGVINNINTQLALEIGSGIIQGLPIDEILEKAVINNKTRFKLIKPTINLRKTIITTCITGIGTAIRIRDLIQKSMGDYVKTIDVLAYDYFKLKNQGLRDDILKDSDIIAIIGTKDPCISEVPFFSLEDIISGKKEAQFEQLLKNVIPEEGIEQINRSIIKYFSLESVLNYITILNPDKIIDQIEMAVDTLQYELKIRFSNDVKIGLYIHLSCLIERLVTKTQIDDYNTDVLSDFFNRHQNFINTVKKSFSVIEKMYSVTIPLAEIYFIFEILNSKIPELMPDAG
ncbi:MAG TPA: sigma 54-interacting transcriptional regulator [Thermoanaerobacterales bacterium]|nr:sigma 54-interacting transcriptional regulator [Thermoanaerobacterales bacterium]